VLPLAGVLFGFGALARIVGLVQNASLSGDEAMLGLNIGRRTFLQLLQPLDYGQVAPIPFLWAERLVVLLGGVSGPSLRIIPLLAGVGVLWVLYRLAAELVGRVEAVVALAIAATSFPLIRYSVEVKPYIVDAFVCAVLVWIAVRLVDDLDDRRNWFWLALSGLLGVLVSTPALLVCGAVAAGVLLTAVRSRSMRAAVALCTVAAFWGLIFSLTYVKWYAPNARAPYMHAFWGQAILGLGTPRLLSRSWLGFQETACTLTCWRGIVNLSPVLLLLAALGAGKVWHRRGLNYAVLLAGPLLAAFGASAIGQYPIAARLVLYASPLLAIMVAVGLVAVAEQIQRLWPQLRARWIMMGFLYPSVILTAFLTFMPPKDWGLRGMEVSPLAEDFRTRSRGEPIYVFARAAPPWVFHTTDWDRPDTTRLAWAARIAGPDGPGFVNGASRGRRIPGEADSLVYRREGMTELFGTPSGSQARMGTGYTPSVPDPGWAESEALRIRDAARPFVWVVMSDYAHPQLDERVSLMTAVREAGGEMVYARETAAAVLYRLRFHRGATD
jgi:Dolichyl-phosphate-mannose-protein mannosyltransferase